MQPGRVRRLHGARRWRADHLVPGSGRPVRRARGHDDRGPRGRRRCCIRCSRRSSSTTDFSAATARRGRSARRSAWRTRSRAACRAMSPTISWRTTIALDHDELRERMSGNLCRCGAHNGIVDAIAEVYAGTRRMIPNCAYTRATDRRRRGPPGAEDQSAKYLGGGTNLVDLMRESDRAAATLVDVTGLSCGIEETDGGGLLIGAAARNTAVAEHPRGDARATRCSRARSWPAPRRRSATWRRSAATCSSAPAAPTSTTSDGSRCNKRVTRRGLRRDRGLQPQSRDPRRVAGLRRDASVGHVRRARGARRRRARSEARRGAHPRRSPISTACPATVPTSRRCSSPAS